MRSYQSGSKNQQHTEAETKRTGRTGAAGEEDEDEEGADDQDSDARSFMLSRKSASNKGKGECYDRKSSAKKLWLDFMKLFHFSKTVC